MDNYQQRLQEAQRRVKRLKAGKLLDEDLIQMSLLEEEERQRTVLLQKAKKQADEHNPYTYQILASVLYACIDYAEGNEQSFDYIAECANTVYEEVFGASEDRITKSLFFASFSRIYHMTMKLLERKVPLFVDLVKKIKPLKREEKHRAALRFVLELLRTGNFKHYYREIIPNREEALEVTTTSTLLKFCFNRRASLDWKQEDIEHFALVVLYAMVFSEDPLRSELLEMVPTVYHTLEMLSTWAPEHMETVTHLIANSDNPSTGVGKGIIYIYNNIVPELDEGAKRAVDAIFFRHKTFSDHGILLHLSDETPTCLILECPNYPHVIGDILVHIEPLDEVLHVFSCEKHREEVKRRLERQHIEAVAEQLATYYETVQTKPAQLTWRRTQEEKRKHVAKISQLIERYRYHQVADESHDGYILAGSIAGERGKAFFAHFISGYTDLAKKMELAPSALALLSALPTLDMEGMISYLDEGLTWISFEEPLKTRVGEIFGLCWGVATEEMFQRAQKRYPLPSKQEQQLHVALTEPFLPWKEEGHDVSEWKAIGLDLVNEWGETIWSITAFLRPNGVGGYKYQFIQNINYVLCGNEQCLISGSDPCEKCLKLIEENLSLFVNILRIRRGEFGVGTAVPVQRKRHQEITRKEANPEKMHKYQDVVYRYDYEIVTINALHLRKAATKEPEHTRGSWMARLDPEQIIYVPENIDLRVRHLKNERFYKKFEEAGVSPQEYNDPAFKGVPIYVKAHVRNKPMKIDTLLRRIERIEAE